MIVLLGGSGYVGSAYQQFLQENGFRFVSVSRKDIDYSDTATLVRFLRDYEPEFLINAAGYTGKPNVDACELDRANCLFGNAVLPGRIADACAEVDVPWGHVSSGCIYTGSRADGSGFSEKDEPNFSFRQNNCSFYSGTKALGEEVLQKYDNVYIWRLRIPFNNVDSPRNYLTKLMRYERLLDATNSVSHLGEFVEATFSCWDKNLPFGLYNVTNPGVVTARHVIELILESGLSSKEFQFFESEEEFMQLAAQTPRSNCVLDSAKLESFGIRMTDVSTIVRSCLEDWKPE